MTTLLRAARVDTGHGIPWERRKTRGLSGRPHPKETGTGPHVSLELDTWESTPLSPWGPEAAQEHATQPGSPGHPLCICPPGTLLESAGPQEPHCPGTPLLLPGLQTLPTLQQASMDTKFPCPE